MERKIKVKKGEEVKSLAWRSRGEKWVTFGCCAVGTFVGKVESWDASWQMREYKGRKERANGEAYLGDALTRPLFRKITQVLPCHSCNQMQL